VRLALLALALTLTAPTLAARGSWHTSNGSRAAVSALSDSFGSFDTREAAQIAALRRISATRVEAGGAVLFNPSTQQYVYTANVGQQDAAHFEAAVRVPAGWQLDSLYHTHPQGLQSSVFSQEDIRVARRLNVPSYMLSRYDNKIRKFAPATSRIVQSANGISSAGEILEEAAFRPKPNRYRPAWAQSLAGATVLAGPDVEAGHRSSGQSCRPGYCPPRLPQGSLSAP
jgi:hypothetical protein